MHGTGLRDRADTWAAAAHLALARDAATLAGTGHAPASPA